MMRFVIKRKISKEIIKPIKPLFSPLNYTNRIKKLWDGEGPVIQIVHQTRTIEYRNDLREIINPKIFLFLIIKILHKSQNKNTYLKPNSK